MIWAALKMIVALGTICISLFFLLRLLKRMDLIKRNIPSDWGIKILTSKLIAPQKYISLVEIGGEVLALGISAQQITFLAKIEDKEKVQRDLPPPAVKTESFSWLQNWPLGQKRFTGGPEDKA